MYEKRSRLRSFFNQYSVLLTKNFILAYRNIKGTLGQILSALFIVLFLLGLQKLSNYVLSQDEPYPPLQSVGMVPKCIDRHGIPCKTIIYAPKIDWVDELMRMVAQDNDLNFEEDFVNMGSNITGKSGFFLDNSTIYNHIVNNQNSTQNAVIFTSAYAEDVLYDGGYILFYNSTYSMKNKFWSPAIPLMRSIDNAILKMRTKSPSAHFEVNTMTSPRATLRIAGYDVVAANGGVWFYIPPMVTFFILLTEIVTEKEERLRLGMRMMGLKDSAYWLTWFTTGLVFNTISTFVLILSGMACGFEVFTNSNFMVVFLMFFLYGVAIQSVAFFLSTLISRTKTAQTVGYAIILIGFVFQTILCSGYGILVDMLYTPDLATWIQVVRVLFSCYPPFNLAKMYSDVAALSSSIINLQEQDVVQGPGFFWSDMYKSRQISTFFTSSPISVPAPVDSLYRLIADTVLFLVLAWYFDNVIPSENGTARSWYFFVTLDYWGIRRKRHQDPLISNSLRSKSSDYDRGYDSDVEKESEDVFMNESSAIRVLDLSKTYRKGAFCKSKEDLKAVAGVSFQINRGEIFCLLGHNGCGKSTTINMLTGLFPPDAGTASIMGNDIRYDMDKIRSLMSVTPQHDITWGELTAEEHLRLFARLKGLDKKRTMVQIEQKLKQVDLWDVRNQRVSGFSGGMRRRLSVAIAAIGDPQIIYMDEPSTGLDPVNRRALWDLILELKKDKAILLTTHNMEEADVLGDRIAIMAFGKIRCVGNSLHLKNKYGIGYRIDLGTDPKNVPQLINEVKSRIPDAILAANDAGSLSFNIPTSSSSPNSQSNVESPFPTLTNLERINSFIQYLEGCPTGFVREWGLSHTTLEEVFLEITKKHGFVYDDGDEFIDHQEKSEHSVDIQTPIEKEKKKVQTNPYRALFRKNFTLQMRQKGTNFCQIVTPVLVMGLLVLLQLIIRSELHGEIKEKAFVPTMPYPLNTKQLNLSFDQGFSLFDEDDMMIRDGEPRDNDEFMYFQPNCLEFFLYSFSESAYPGYLYSNGTDDGLLSWIEQTYCLLENGTQLLVPYFSERDSLDVMDREIIDDVTEYNKLPISKVKEPPHSYLLPDGQIVFQDIDPIGLQLNFTFAVNDQLNKLYHRNNGFTKLNLNIINSSWINSTITNKINPLIILEGRLALMSMIHDAFIHMVTNSSVFIPKLAIKFAQMMPYFASENILDALEIVGTLLYPVALTLQLPIYIYILVLEKSTKLKELMKMHGMKMSAYIFTNCIFNFTLYCIVIAFFWLVGVGIEIRFFSQTHPSVLLVFFAGWGLALISMGFFFSAFLSSPRAATIIGYVIALMGSLFGLVVAVGIYGVLPWSLHNTLPTGYLIWPQMAFIRGIYLLNYACAESFACYGPITELTMESEFLKVVIFLYCDAFVLFILGLYLEEVIPHQYGISRHPLFFILDFLPKKKSNNTDLKNVNNFVTSYDEFSPLITNISNPEDEDVKIERSRVEGFQCDPNQFPLITNKLRKTFGKKVAVKDLSFAVEQGECFGLLGENGAGKTTTISIVTGLIKPTNGVALVGGYDIRKEMSKVHLVIGVCPQFSILWESLSVIEHLLFYARLKGIPAKHEKEHVEHSLSQFGLSNARNRLSRDLSGGMQRRLSVAIALVGNSEIVFLDEPTTGLDPASKRQLWKVINNAKSGRAFVLTTHSMEEAETLCSRIGIVVLGEMRCLGTPLHLKSKFSEGYRLNINFQPEDVMEASNCIEKIFGHEAKEVASYQGTKEYRISIQQGKISEVFSLLESNFGKGKYSPIIDWSLSMIGLEDVFQKIVKDSHQNNYQASANIPMREAVTRTPSVTNLNESVRFDSPRSKPRINLKTSIQ